MSPFASRPSGSGTVPANMGGANTDRLTGSFSPDSMNYWGSCFKYLPDPHI